MNFYTNQHKYFCGIDLNTKKMYVCILDSAGLPAGYDFFDHGFFGEWF